MADLTNTQRREWAAILYLKENLTQAEIAEKVGVSRVTVNKWIDKYKWKELKVGLVLTKEEQLKNLYRQVSELNETIAEREKGERFPTTAESDTLSKLAKIIATLETEVGVAEIMSVSKQFMDFVRPIDLEAVKVIAHYAGLFVQSKL